MRSADIENDGRGRSVSILPVERDLAFAVHVGTKLYCHFQDLREAIAAAKLLNWQEPLQGVSVTDTRTGQVVIEMYV